DETLTRVLETTLVIEKDTWDDTFPLEGGGRVHMKLQFLLSEEDHGMIFIHLSYMSQRFEANPDEVSSSSGDKSGTTASSTDGPLSMIGRKEALQMGNAGSSIAVKDKIPVKMKEVGVGDQEKRRRLSRDQINVRSMISGFEKMGSESPFVKELSRVTTQDMAELYGTRAAQFQTKGTKSDLKDKLKVGTVQEKRVSEDLLRASMGKRASISGRGFNEHPGAHSHSNLLDRKQSSPGNPGINSGRATDLRSSQGASGDEHYSSERNRGWEKSFCITTAGKQIMNIMGGFWGDTKDQSPEASSSAAAENSK
ncbi:hypothetical protein Tsubulata_040786, partial [Turnera subulata]